MLCREKNKRNRAEIAEGVWKIDIAAGTGVLVFFE